MDRTEMTVTRIRTNRNAQAEKIVDKANEAYWMPCDGSGRYPIVMKNRRGNEEG